MPGPYQDPTIDELNRVAAKNPMPGLMAQPPRPTPQPVPASTGMWQKYKDMIRGLPSSESMLPGTGAPSTENNFRMSPGQEALATYGMSAARDEVGKSLGEEFPAFFGDDGNGIGNRLARWWSGEPSGQKNFRQADPPSGATPTSGASQGGGGQSNSSSWTAAATPRYGMAAWAAGGAGMTQEPPRKVGQVLATVGGKKFDYTDASQQPGRLAAPLSPGPTVTAFDPMYGYARTVGRPGGGTARPGVSMESGSFEGRPFRDQTPAQADVSMENAIKGAGLTGARQFEQYQNIPYAQRSLFHAQLAKLGDPKNQAMDRISQISEQQRALGDAAVQELMKRLATDPRSAGKPVPPELVALTRRQAMDPALAQEQGLYADVGAGRYPPFPQQ